MTIVYCVALAFLTFDLVMQKFLERKQFALRRVNSDLEFSRDNKNPIQAAGGARETSELNETMAI